MSRTKSESYTSKVGNGILLLLLAINVALWVLCTPSLQEGEFTQQLFSEFCATVAMILMSFSIVLSTRARGLESLFGGLDKMYLAHKRNGILAIIFLVTHFFALAKKPPAAGEVEVFNPGAPLGMLAFAGLLVMVVMAVAPRIPFIGGHIKLAYSRWQITHKAIGVFFVVGFIHMILVDKMMERSVPLKAFIGIICLIGVLAYIYKLVVFRFVRRKLPYVVKEANRLNPSIVEVVLEPIKQKLQYKAGQFLFVEFQGDKLLSESHPFTISSAPSNDDVHLTIRASGDYTKHAFKNLKPGTPANLEGSYGRFDYTQGSDRQVWVAGGIGLTPFLSWVRQFKDEKRFVVDLFYTVSSKEDAIFLEELKQAAQSNPNLNIHVSFSNVDGHLNADKIVSQLESIADRDFFFCGPAAMTDGISNQLIASGVAKSKIHFEEFSFR